MNCSAEMLVDSNGRIHSCNHWFQKMFAYNLETIKGSYFWDVVSTPEHANLDKLRFKKLHYKRFLAEHESNWHAKNGTAYNIKWSGTPFIGEGKKVKFIALRAEVQTDRDEVEELGEASRELADDRLTITEYSLNKAAIATFWVGPKAEILYANSESCRLLGFSRKELLNMTVHDFDLQYTKEVWPLHWCELKANKAMNFESTYKTKDGKIIPVEIKINYLSFRGKEYNIVFVSDITERKQREQSILYRSYHDGLTDIYNRNYFDEMVRKLDSEENLPLSIIIGDVNGLKLVNYAFGHEEGDKILIEIASILKSTCRRDDFIARWGGDEFAIILPQTDKKAAEEVCSRIKKACSEKIVGMINLSISMGIGTKVHHDQSIKLVLKKAEDLMYKRKLTEGKKIRNSIILSLERVLEEKGIETVEHSKRMRKMALLVGEALDLPANKLNELHLLSALHDVGKISTPEEIFNKPGELTTEEWETIRKHSEVGYRIANTTPELAAIAEAILSHHERWDGRGYPQGLKGEEIPLIARIVTILKAYDVMTNGRPYKESLNHHDAIDELKRCAGTQFDAGLVELFIKVITENSEEIIC